MSHGGTVLGVCDFKGLEFRINGLERLTGYPAGGGTKRFAGAGEAGMVERG